MTNKQHIVLIFGSLLLVLPASGWAQYSYQIGESTDALKRLKKVNPASLQYINPDKGESDYDVRLGYKGAFDEQELGSFGNYNFAYQYNLKFDAVRDTFSKNPQNNYKLGVGVDLFGNEAPLDSGDNIIYFNIGADISYARDEEKDIESYVIGVDYLPYSFLYADRLRSISSNPSSSIRYYHVAKFSSAYEKTIDAPVQGDGSPGKGSNSRFWFSETLKIYPFFNSQGERVELSYNGEFGRDLSSSGIYKNTDNTWRYNEVSLNYYFTCEQTFSISLVNSNGEKRRENTADDSRTAIALRFSWPPKEDALQTCLE